MDAKASSSSSSNAVVVVSSSKANNLAARILKQATVADIIAVRPSSNEIVFVRTSDSVTKALQHLNKAHVSSAPVLDMHGNVVLGFVDLLDITKYIAASVAKPEEAKDLDLSSVTVGSVMNMSDRDSCVPIADTADGLLAAEQLTTLHRLAVYDERQTLRAVLSQLDIVRFVNTKLQAHQADQEEAKAMLHAPVTALGLGSRLQINSRLPRVARLFGPFSHTVLQAVQKLAITGLSALALVDEDTGELIGNFSATDLRACYADSDKHPGTFLLSSVNSYLEKHHPTSMQPVSDKRFFPSAPMNFGQLLELMLTKEIHHVWMLDSVKNKQPIGVISTTDIMRMLVHTTPDSYGWKGKSSHASHKPLAAAAEKPLTASSVPKPTENTAAAAPTQATPPA